MTIFVTGATGLTGTLFLTHLAEAHPGAEVCCLVRPNSDRQLIESLNLKIGYFTGDSETKQTWDEFLAKNTPETIIHIASIRHVPVILNSLKTANQSPRLIIVGTTGVYSQYNHYSATYKQIESQLTDYAGSYCLLRPTMIYGSHRDKNLHKLIKFCSRYGFFPVFGGGTCLLQPVHADDLAKATLSALQRSEIQGAYDLSGGSVVTFKELLALVENILGKPIRPLNLPLNAGVALATTLEKALGRRSPVRREQILRLQEDKAYPNDAARQDLDFFPRTLEVGLQQEVELLRSEGIIS